MGEEKIGCRDLKFMYINTYKAMYRFYHIKGRV